MQINRKCGLAYVILTSYFNARTGQLQDFIINDSDNHLPLPPDYETDH